MGGTAPTLEGHENCALARLMPCPKRKRSAWMDAITFKLSAFPFCLILSCISAQGMKNLAASSTSRPVMSGQGTPKRSLLPGMFQFLNSNSIHGRQVECFQVP